ASSTRTAATGGDARQLVGYLVSDSGLPLDTAALKASSTRTAATGGDARQLVGYLVSDSGLPLDTAAL
ncbi:hypothetical protein CKF46_38060, partial [Klebsiella pneumoniae]